MLQKVHYKYAKAMQKFTLNVYRNTNVYLYFIEANTLTQYILLKRFNQRLIVVYCSVIFKVYCCINI